MPSSLPTLDEIRRVFRLVGECTELGADPVLWRQRLAEGCSALIGDHFVNVVESRVTMSPAGVPVPTTLGYFNGGPLPNERLDIISRFMEAPADISPTVPRLLDPRRPSVTRLRCEPRCCICCVSGSQRNARRENAPEGLVAVRAWPTTWPELLMARAVLELPPRVPRSMMTYS